MADIFVSYQKEDREVAERLVAALGSTGRSVWWDEALTPHHAWDASIEREIEAARAVIVLWSPRSVQSDWVRTEAHYAQDHNKLIPVIIDNCHLPLAFALRQAVDISDGKFDESSPTWRKLTGWVEDVIERRSAPEERIETAPLPPAATAPPEPQSAAVTTAATAWRKPAVLGGAAAAVALLAGAFFWFGHGASAVERPQLYVDSFETVEGVPASVAVNLQDEIITGLSGSSRIAPIVGDGRTHDDAYRIAGRLARSGDKLQLFGRIFAPGHAGPVLSTKLEGPADSPFAARDLAYEFAEIARCVATGSDGVGQATQVIPDAAMEPWSRFCVMSIAEQVSAENIVPTLEQVVEAAPEMTAAWANLATYYGSMGFRRPEEVDTYWAKAEEAADRALALDSGNAAAKMTLAYLALYKDALPGKDEPLKRLDIATFERLGSEAIEGRPSECFCEMHNYGYFLLSLGRTSEAAKMFQRSYELDPTQVSAAAVAILTQAMDGDMQVAREQLVDLAKDNPDDEQLRGVRLQLAIMREDYAEALAITIETPPAEFQPVLEQVLAARVRGDKAAAHAAAAPLAAKVETATMNGNLFYSVLLGGYPDESAQLLTRMVKSRGFDWLSEGQGPEFAEVRRTKTFENLVRGTGLMDYWRTSKTVPYYCGKAGAPAWCSGLS